MNVLPNPILRLGQQAHNFRKLTSNQAVTQIGAYAKAMKANQPRLEEERKNRSEKLKEQIKLTVATLGAVEMSSVQAMLKDETELAELAPSVLEVLKRASGASLISELESISEHLTGVEQYLLEVFSEGDFNPQSLWSRTRRDALLAAFTQEHSDAP